MSDAGTAADHGARSSFGRPISIASTGNPEERRMHLTLDDVQAARALQAPYVRHTPIEESPDFSGMVGRQVFLKLENLQRTGAFKIRGAISRLLEIEPVDRARGVVTASAGNHGQGVALAANLLGVPATVV